MDHRANYSRAQEEVKIIQKRLYGPPTRLEIAKSVKGILKKHKLRDSVENYFRLWAICALLGKEPMCAYWKSDPKKELKRRIQRDLARLERQEKAGVFNEDGRSPSNAGRTGKSKNRNRTRENKR